MPTSAGAGRSYRFVPVKPSIAGTSGPKSSYHQVVRRKGPKKPTSAAAPPLPSKANEASPGEAAPPAEDPKTFAPPLTDTAPLHQREATIPTPLPTTTATPASGSDAEVCQEWHSPQPPVAQPPSQSYGRAERGGRRQGKQQHSGYRLRTKTGYTLPGTYATSMEQWTHRPVVRVRVMDAAAPPLPPSRAELRLRGDVRLGTRQSFVTALRQAAGRCGGDVVPPAFLAKVAVPPPAEDVAGPAAVRAASEAAVAAYDFNFTTADAFDDYAMEFVERQRQTERRMWSRLIVDVEPLSQAVGWCSAAGSPCVMDSGHLDEPILLLTQPSEVEPSTMAVVVRPFTDELLQSPSSVLATEARRRLPRGREWDRQAAIQQAVGLTAQEAIIDLGIDIRYRQPGQHLLTRNSRAERGSW